jgi:hypothetical protein
VGRGGGGILEEEPKWNHDRRRDLGVTGGCSWRRDGPAPGVSMA